MKTISSPKSVSLLIALLTSFVLMLLIPQQSHAAISTTRAVIKCATSEHEVCTKGNGIGKATARGTISSTSYTARTSTFVFDSRKKTKVDLQVMVSLFCESSTAGSSESMIVEKTFTKKHSINKGRNVKSVSGKKVSCPSGYKIVPSVSDVVFSVIVNKMLPTPAYKTVATGHADVNEIK